MNTMETLLRDPVISESFTSALRDCVRAGMNNPSEGHTGCVTGTVETSSTPLNAAAGAGKDLEALLKTTAGGLGLVPERDHQHPTVFLAALAEDPANLRLALQQALKKKVGHPRVCMCVCPSLLTHSTCARVCPADAYPQTQQPPAWAASLRGTVSV